MANPTKVSYRLATSNVDGSPLAPADIKHIEIGLGTTAGQYTTIVADTSFQPDAQGISSEPLSVFGALPPGTYFLAARTVSKLNVMSDWSTGVTFTVDPPVPKAPTAVSVS